MPQVRHAWLVQELGEDVLATAAAVAREAGALPMQLCPRANACTPDGIRAALARGHSVRGWGVRTLEVLTRFLGCQWVFRLDL